MNSELRDWLMRGWKLEWEITALMNAREEALAKCLSAGGSGTARVSGSKSVRSRPMEAYAELSDKINDRIDCLCSVRTEIIDAIAALPESRMRAVLTERYVACYTWEVIAEHLNTDTRNIYRLHLTALRMLENETDSRLYARKSVCT